MFLHKILRMDIGSNLTLGNTQVEVQALFTLCCWQALSNLGGGISNFCIKGFGNSLCVVVYTFSVSAVNPRIWKKYVALLACFVWSVNPNMTSWTVRAMDTSLFVFFSLLVLVFALDIESKPNKPHVLAIGIVLGLVVLARPEGWLLTIVILFYMSRYGLKLILLTLLGPLIIVSPYYFFMYSQLGSILPSSSARMILARARATNIAGILISFAPLKYFLHPQYLFFLVPFGTAVLSTFDMKWSQRLSCKRMVLILWLSIMLLFYMFVFLSGGDRYLLPIVPIFIILAMDGGSLLTNVFGERWLQVVFLGLIVSLSVLMSIWTTFQNRDYLVRYMADSNDKSARDMALWLKNNTPEDSIVAAKEFSEISFYSSRKILDLEGIIDSSVIPFRKQNRLVDYLKERNPEYLLVESYIYETFPPWKNSRLAILATASDVGSMFDINGVKFVLRHVEPCPYYPGYDRSFAFLLYEILY